MAPKQVRKPFNTGKSGSTSRRSNSAATARNRSAGRIAGRAGQSGGANLTSASPRAAGAPAHTRRRSITGRHARPRINILPKSRRAIELRDAECRYAVSTTNNCGRRGNVLPIWMFGWEALSTMNTIEPWADQCQMTVVMSHAATKISGYRMQNATISGDGQHLFLTLTAPLGRCEDEVETGVASDDELVAPDAKNYRDYGFGGFGSHGKRGPDGDGSDGSSGPPSSGLPSIPLSRQTSTSYSSVGSVH